MKRLLGIFRLTSPEQRVIVIVILALLAIAIVQKHHERTERALPRQSSRAGATTPGAAEGE